MDYSGKFVVVVGGTSGINLGVAESFARQGANLAVVSRSIEKVKSAISYIQDIGVSCDGFHCDVRDYEGLETGLAELVERNSKIDVLVSGAAGNFPAFANEMSPNAFKSVVDIDLQGTYHVLRAAFTHLQKPGAAVINISAPQAFLPMMAQSHVCAAKAGVDMMTRCTALEWGEYGVRVNSVVPGPIEGTEGMKRLAPSPKMIEETARSVPLHRLGQKQDIGNACLFLASPMASYITGVVLPVDGGWSLGGASALGNTLAGMLKSH